MKKIVIEPTDWVKIVNFISAISVPFGQSVAAAEVLIAVNNAREVEASEPEKKEIKKKEIKT